MENIVQAWEMAEHEQMLDEIPQDIGLLLLGQLQNDLVKI